MKVVKIFGGLGNQMFQYAFGKLISADAYDISWFEESKNENVTPRQYELDVFNCTPTILTKQQHKKIIQNNKILKIFGIKTGLHKIKEQPANVYNQNYLKQNNGFFVGYWQCADYYDSIRKQLLQEFTLKTEPNNKNKKIFDLINSTNSVSLHVRRGDYVKLQETHGLCNLDYYNQAIDFIDKKVKNPHFFIFSDDIKWVKKNLKTEHPCTFIDFNHDKDSVWDIFLMKHCKHNIIANSSFSWWGAWLNENQNKIVIAPKKWWADGTQIDIVPNKWKRI